MTKLFENEKPIVLIVDDRYRVFHGLPELISGDAFSPIWVPDERKGLRVLKKKRERIRIVIVDLKSSGMGGGGFLQQARQIAPQAAFLITGPLGPFLYQGGEFYEFSGPGLKQEINAVLLGIAQKMNAPSRDGKKKDGRYPLRERFGAIIGKSPCINEIYRLIESLKGSSSTVLVQGESGTGKELVARMIHRTSRRSRRPFVAINCGAIPSNLMESELFGHERGSFTTAFSQRKGKFEIATGGTLFLDEIGELDRDLQVKLLRVLQEREFERVGGNRTFKTDVRVIAATSKDLKRAVQSGHFREELFYRLNVVPIRVPPLRERREDIPLLLDYFSHKISKEMGRRPPLITTEARNALMEYSYPGNVRELANVVERLLVTCPNSEIRSRDLPQEMRNESHQREAESRASELFKKLPAEGVPLQEAEKELILRTLQLTSGNKRAAAKMLGITRRLLYLRLAEYGFSSTR